VRYRNDIEIRTPAVPAEFKEADMDSKHRHEMMTNELADWMGHIPDFLNTYRNQLIGIALVIIGLVSWPILNRWRQQSDFTAKAQISGMLDSLETSRYLAVRQQQDNQQESSTESFLAAANNLADEAKKAPTDDLAAIALIKRGQALRMDLFYRKEAVTEDAASAQTKLAQEAYQQALDKAKLPTVKAMAQFGLGLCSEESGQLEQAKVLYQKIIDEPTCAGTPLPTAAKSRIDKMADNNTKYVFAEVPKEIPAAVTPEAPLPAENAPAIKSSMPAPVITVPSGQEKK
jgi:tetratricopeptide (TPR) repeat protein